MFYELIKEASDNWWGSRDCPCQKFLQYIEEKGQLRKVQIEAIKHYLYLKVVHKGQPLYRIFSEHIFAPPTEPVFMNTSGAIIKPEREDIPLHNLMYYSNKANREELPNSFRDKLLKSYNRLKGEELMKNIFYGITYTDYLFSLPMGAGKTFLMACFIYIDLYFSSLEPRNEAFAHNFLILIPSGLKSSILPSLKSIQDFDPSWILPPEVAKQIEREIKFEVLDEKKSASKSNRIKNQNAQKINAHSPLNSLRGLVAITNAEKLIERVGELDKVAVNEQLLDSKELQEIKVANELREIISQIPHLSILIDEVHHASDGEIKLRQVVTEWANKGSVTNVLGFSGTPYLARAEEVYINETNSFKTKTISNIVYHLPLIKGISNFLKKPDIKYANQGGNEIVRRGVKEFIEKYAATTYANGTMAKLAIYCGTIQRLEEEIYPIVTELALEHHWDPATTILKYHRGNRDYPQPEAAEYHFASLDTPLSKHRIVLLVQIGKEGWDCRSLTSVILPQKGACPYNMVLQTSCRCLREMDDASNETALIWLNQSNAQSLNQQLKEQQHTDIKTLNSGNSELDFVRRNRYNRLKETKLTEPINYFQLKLEYLLETASEGNNPSERLKPEDILLKSDETIITTQDLSGNVTSYESTLATAQSNETSLPITFREWIATIIKESFNTISYNDLMEYESDLRYIFEEIIEVRDELNELLYLSPSYDQQAIRAEIRKAFVPYRELKIKEEIVPTHAQLLLVDKLESPIYVPTFPPIRELYYPDEKETEAIIAFDKGNNEKTLISEVQQAIDNLSKIRGNEALIEGLRNNPDNYLTVNNLNVQRSYHYLPYHFDSFLERRVFEKILLPMARERGLEVYFNGDDQLTEFAINCYEREEGRNWKYVGRYIPDFLMLQRGEKDAISKILIIETKGSLFAFLFKEKKEYMQYFLKLNNEQNLPYQMDFLYLEQEGKQIDKKEEERLVREAYNKIDDFFN